MLVNANTNFKQYFADEADSLNRLQQRVNTALGDAMAKNKDYNTYLATLGAGCKDPSLTDKGFLSDMTQVISWIQTVNTNYSANLDKNINDAITSYTNLAHLLDSTEQDLPVKDEDEFQANVVVATSNVPATQTISIVLPVTKPVKIDFSAGAFYTNLYNEISQLRKVQGQDSFFLKTTRSNDYTLGPMGFINFHTQFRSYANGGLFLGSGLAFNQSAKLVLAGGGSLLLGKFQRLIIHAGVAFAQVDRISSLYPDGTVFGDASYKADVIQQWKSGFFAGLSWNLSRSN
jgi:hypothetical protein